MKIVEILLGVVKDGAATTETFPVQGSTTIGIAEPDLLARALRETLAAPTREAAKDRVPFVRITAREGTHEVSVADDASAGLRMLSETKGDAMPQIIEAKAGDDEAIDTLLGRVAHAFSADDSEMLYLALGRVELGARAPISDENAQRAYEAVQQKKLELERAVREVDDKMTKSVVPDWLWVATGFGGIGVMMTVVALLYPQLRASVLPVMIAISVLGFGGYGFMSWRELKRRSALMAQRKSLRAQREEARKEARDFAARGVILSEGSGSLDHLPAILSDAPATEHPLRQVIVLANKPA